MTTILLIVFVAVALKAYTSIAVRDGDSVSDRSIARAVAIERIVSDRRERAY